MYNDYIMKTIGLLLPFVLISCGSGGQNDSSDASSTSDTALSPSGVPTVSGPLTTIVDAEISPGVTTPPGNQVVDPATIASPTSPPFSGTNFINPDIITADDPSAFLSISANGTGDRVMFDRRPNDWVTLEPYLFIARYEDGLSIEIQINPEFEEREASDVAETYARYFGQLPTLLRRDVDTSWIHKGVQLYGGGNRNILIHTGQSAEYLRLGILEETLVHEASHSSLDSYHAAADGWLAAQQADPTFISTYALENPGREDIAESFLLYMALRYKRDRISNDLASTIEASIPNRIQYFDTIVEDMYPLE